MRRLLIVILCSFTMVFEITAQQDPQYSQYMFNQMAVNPGYAGSRDAVCLSAVHRQQWEGIDRPPVTSVFTANAPFKFKGTSHGIGLEIINDNLGFGHNISIGMDYAYRLPLGNGKLGIGVGGMFLNKALSAMWSTIDGSVKGNGTEDIVIPEPNESVMGFDMNVGIFYRAENVYMGISSTHLLESSLNYEKTKDKLNRHYYATAGCLLSLNNPAWEISPSVMAYSDGTASQFTINVNFMYNKKFWSGVGYRLNDAIIAMIGFDLFEGVKLGYAFDYSYTSLNNYFKAGGSHEVVLSYCFNLIKDRVVKKYKSVRFL